MYKLLRCDTVDVVRIGYGVDLYIDDEGLFNGEAFPFGFSFGRGVVICGSALVVGHDGQGETADCKINVEDVISQVRFGIVCNEV